MSESNQIVLIFSEQWQESIVGHMLGSNLFFLNCVMLLEHVWFIDPTVSELFRQIKLFYEEHKRQPTVVEMKGVIQYNNPSSVPDRTRYFDKIDKCVASSKNIGIDLLSNKLTTWVKSVKFREMLVSGADIFNRQKDPIKAIDLVSDDLNKIHQINFFQDDVINFSDGVQFFRTFEEQFSRCCTTGHPDFDELLRSGSKIASVRNGSHALIGKTSGGLVGGDTTILLGASNAGKTTTGVTVIASNIQFRKSILYFIHEQKWEDIKKKIFSNLLSRPVEYLTTGADRWEEAFKNRVELVGSLVDQYLTFINWVKTGSMYIEDVVARINMEQEKRIMSHGRGYDLLVVDYPAKLKSRRHGSKTAVWEEIDYVYDQFVSLALQHRFHSFLMAQTNREGYKINKGNHSTQKMVDQGSIGGSFGIAQKADNVISINRNKYDIDNDRIKFYISKSRSASGEMVFASETNFSHNRTHGLDLHSQVLSSTDFECMTDETLLGVTGGTNGRTDK